jgi:hypothetical protein
MASQHPNNVYQLPFARPQAQTSVEATAEFTNFAPALPQPAETKPARESEEMSEQTREEVDAKIAASEARADTKFAQLFGKIDTSNAELKGELGKIAVRIAGVERSTGGLHTTIIVTAVAVVGVLVAILTFGQQWLGIGLTTRDLVHAVAAEIELQKSSPARPPPAK